MKLYFSPASPYVRKVMVVAHETGLVDRIEKIDGSTTPVSPNSSLATANALAKIPTLVTDSGEALFDSRVICEYLDGQHKRKRLFPSDRDARWRALTRQALADGILDSAVGTRYETVLRPEQYRWPEWIAGQKGKFRRGLDQLERDASALDGPLDIGTIAVGCALGYLDFRYADENWRASRPRLAKWFEVFGARPSMKATAPG